jgi:RHS repeat-associated protein
MLRYNAGSDNIGYDENGNMMSLANSCGTTNYTWDARNRLIGISGFNTDCSALSASFKYDALGRRLEKTVNGKTTQYLYDGLDIVQEIENSVVTANYIRTLNIDEPLARVKADGSVRYYQQDALGSVIGLVDDTGAVKTQYAYDPFGSVTVTGEASDNPFQYTGRENDNTGLYYYRARYYSPELQRFISEDPILRPMNLISVSPSRPLNKIVWFLPFLKSDPKKLQSYAFVANGPLNLKDPLGLTSYCDYGCGLICGVMWTVVCSAQCGPAAPACSIVCSIIAYNYCYFVCNETCKPPKPPDPPKPPVPPAPPAPPGDGGSTC